jgi:hypothetical protein
MARLPHARLAIIDEPKITNYLLASGHPAGRAKAAFFQLFGFRAVEWRSLKDALREHARRAQIISVRETEFGREYILEGSLFARDGREPQVRSVWFIATGEKIPRLVTAYPMPGAER